MGSYIVGSHIVRALKFLFLYILVYRVVQKPLDTKDNVLILIYRRPT